MVDFLLHRFNNILVVISLEVNKTIVLLKANTNFNLISLSVVEIRYWKYYLFGALIFWTFIFFSIFICRVEKKTIIGLRFNQIAFVLNLIINTELVDTYQVSETDQISPETRLRLIELINLFEKEHRYKDPCISLTSLASEFGTNRSYLSAILRERNNENFNSYLNTLRVEYVITLLNHETELKLCKIAYISALAGFSSHSQFSTVFKRVKGVTFSKYLKEI
ncbi:MULTISPECIES: helix-turn-helix domain-containing protein [Myroides]|uniref:Helix-turn-helix domain-containing protein n=1 Tax=Myroides profundi TaxID=480520 RepID=A0AAJ4W6N8_MYRPR|nr:MULTISPECIES: helix-turn-helix domain-containing protein [Myroides]AJH15622.1 hypothetical protein MPR_2453 [Myroides profundi]MCA4807993.1 AraC family transcriptional regulator [Myroides odoratimimus]SER54003.1 Helix-turn-helix domain-containing protein [Myroides profundi]